MKKKLKELLDYEQPTKYIVETENYSDEYETPVLTAGKSFILGYTNETDGIFEGKNEPVIIFDDFTRDTKFVDFNFKVKSSAMKILHKHNKDDSLKYLHYAISNIKYVPFSHKRLWISDFSNIAIDYPSKEEQQKIATELDSIQSAIANKKQQLLLLDEIVKSKFAEMFGDPIYNSKGWDLKTITDICKEIYGGGTPSKSRADFYQGNIPWITSKDMKSLIISDSKDHINQDAIENSSAKKIKPNSVLMVIRSGILKHTLPVAVNKVEVTVNQDLKAFIPSEQINPFFLLFYFKGIEQSVLAGVRATTADNIDFNQFKKRKIIVPPIALQNRFATFVLQIDKSKFVVKQQITDLQELLDSKMQEYFGE